MQKLFWMVLFSVGLGACAQTDTSKHSSHPITHAQSECEAELALRLVGQDDFPDARIKDLTRAQVVRRLGPNQMMTADYRVERVTVLVDPVTKKIIRATCG